MEASFMWNWMNGQCHGYSKKKKVLASFFINNVIIRVLPNQAISNYTSLQRNLVLLVVRIFFSCSFCLSSESVTLFHVLLLLEVTKSVVKSHWLQVLRIWRCKFSFYPFSSDSSVLMNMFPAKYYRNVIWNCEAAQFFGNQAACRHGLVQLTHCASVSVSH